MESILNSVKKLLGISIPDKSFDDEIIIQINMALMNVALLGIGPPEGFVIKDNKTTWVDFIGERSDIEGIKTYIYLKVRLVFDPPQTGPLVEAINKQITELEWKLTVQVESTEVVTHE